MKALQLKFLEALDNPLPVQDMLTWIKAEQLAPSSQMAIYQGSVRGGLLGVLRATFPVCCRLVGDDYFRKLAKEYITQTAHSEPDITSYGQSFSFYIQENMSMHQLCYLPDVVALEWACHLALNGPPVSQLDQTALACVTLEQQSCLQFALDQSSTLLYSKYPVLRIWQVNQAEYQGEDLVSLLEGEIHLLIYRRSNKLCLTPLTEQAFKMLTYFSAGNSFEWVCQQCIKEFPLIDIPRLFAECVQNEYFVRFDLDEN